MSIIIKKIEPKEVLKNKKTSATKTKEVRGVNEKRNKSKKVRTKAKFVIYIYIYILYPNAFIYNLKAFV